MIRDAISLIGRAIDRRESELRGEIRRARRRLLASRLDLYRRVYDGVAGLIRDGHGPEVAGHIVAAVDWNEADEGMERCVRAAIQHAAAGRPPRSEPSMDWLSEALKPQPIDGPEPVAAAAPGHDS